MATLQISKIQVRRGRRNSGTGMPQLASGEFGWAIDTQELYIGNGSVAEGAPTVGNTKVLTRTDLNAESGITDILTYMYQYKSVPIITGADINHPTVRTLSDRLSDQVNAKNFNVQGNGVIDDTTAIQQAIDQLYLNNSAIAAETGNSNTELRLTLNFNPGIYNVSETILLPSFVKLVGAGPHRTIFKRVAKLIVCTVTINNELIYTDTAAAKYVGAKISGPGIADDSFIVDVDLGVSITINQIAIDTFFGPLELFIETPIFETVRDLDSTELESINQPRSIVIENLSIHTSSANQTAIKLLSTKNSQFKNISLSGAWTGDLNSTSMGVELDALSSLITCQNNTFEAIDITGFMYGIYAKKDIINNTFRDCVIHGSEYDLTAHTGGRVLQGITLGLGVENLIVGEEFGPRNTKIIDCTFIDIIRYAVLLDRGVGNIIENCKLTNVGNELFGVDHPVWPQIYVNQIGNTVLDIVSDRTAIMSESSTEYSYIPEISGHGLNFTNWGIKQININITDVIISAFKVPVPMSYDTLQGIVLPEYVISHAIDYDFKNHDNTVLRHGRLSITADVQSTVISTLPKITITDTYQSIGSELISTALIFSADYIDQYGDVYTGVFGQLPMGILIRYVNDQGTYGTLTYNYITVI